VRFGSCRTDCRGNDAGRVEIPAAEWNGNRRLVDQIRRHDSQCLCQRRLRMRRARRRVDEGNGLADKLAAPDDPAERVLENPWDAMRVLGTGNENGGGGVELGTTRTVGLDAGQRRFVSAECHLYQDLM
jgi:hypothetical protein